MRERWNAGAEPRVLASSTTGGPSYRCWSATSRGGCRMLEPTSRKLFLDALTPPADHVLDVAIGTTFTLDLQALLCVPIALAFSGWDDPDGEPIRDPIALLEALRRLAERISIFCEAGAIAVPPIDQRL